LSGGDKVLQRLAQRPQWRASRGTQRDLSARTRLGHWLEAHKPSDIGRRDHAQTDVSCPEYHHRWELRVHLCLAVPPERDHRIRNEGHGHRFDGADRQRKAQLLGQCCLPGRPGTEPPASVLPAHRPDARRQREHAHPGRLDPRPGKRRGEPARERVEGGENALREVDLRRRRPREEPRLQDRQREQAQPHLGQPRRVQTHPATLAAAPRRQELGRPAARPLRGAPHLGDALPRRGPLGRRQVDEPEPGGDGRRVRLRRAERGRAEPGHRRLAHVRHDAQPPSRGLPRHAGRGHHGLAQAGGLFRVQPGAGRAPEHAGVQQECSGQRGSM